MITDYTFISDLVHTPAAMYHAVKATFQKQKLIAPVYPNDHLSWDEIPSEWCDIDKPQFAKFKSFMNCPQATLLAMSEVARFLKEARDRELSLYFDFIVTNLMSDSDEE